MATIPLQFSFTTARQPAMRRMDDEDPFRILVLADLGGSAVARAALPLARRKPLAIDIDNFDRVLARLSPHLELQLDDATLNLDFQSLDDFHPDRLFARLAPFAALRQLRDELADPAQFRRAAVGLGAIATPASPVAAAPAKPVDGAESADMERLLGRKPAAAVAAAPTLPGGVNLDGWLRRVVAAHVVQDTTTEQAHWLAAADLSIASAMRRVLHHPAFQALEANWRSIERLVRELDPGDTLHLLLLDVSRAELTQDIAAHAADLSQSALHHHLCGPQTEPPDGQRWSLLVSDLGFAACLADLQLLAALGALAGRAGAPLLASAELSLLGCSTPEQLAASKTWPPLAADVAAFWMALRQSAVAAWLGLALPRILTRLPYGKRSDPIEAFAFDELASRNLAHYLWASPAFSLALLAGQAFIDGGWEMDLAGQLDISDLPSHIYHEDGESKQQPCAETAMSESGAEAVLRHGIMPTLGLRQHNAVRLLRWQSIAEPAQALQGGWR